MNGYLYNKACPCPRCRARSLHGAALLITIGVLWLLDTLRVIYFEQSWPLILIVVGIFTLASRSAPKEGHVQPYWAGGDLNPPAATQQNPQVKP